ncbi:519_t:CDS:2, partial [Acaulospora colombiana]
PTDDVRPSSSSLELGSLKEFTGVSYYAHDPVMSENLVKAGHVKGTSDDLASFDQSDEPLHWPPSPIRTVLLHQPRKPTSSSKNHQSLISPPAALSSDSMLYGSHQNPNVGDQLSNSSSFP